MAVQARRARQGRRRPRRLRFQAHAVAVLTAVLARSGSEQPAHQTITTEQNTWAGIAQLAAEYETIAADATRDWYETIVRDALIGTGDLTVSEIDAVIASDAFGPLATQMRRAEASGFDLTTVVPDLACARKLHDADDVAAVLHFRLINVMNEPIAIGYPDLIVGLIPAASGEMPSDVRSALDERRELIESRATTLAINAVRTREAWVQQLGEETSPGGDVALWLHQVEVVAAYRDRYDITDKDPLGPEPATLLQQRDAHHAAAAIGYAIEIASTHQEDGLDDSLNRGLGLA